MGAALEPIYANSAAIRILAYPQDPRTLASPNNFLAAKLQAILKNGQPSHYVSMAEFTSGKRRYLCRAFSLGSSSGNGSSNGSAQPKVAVVLERKVLAPFDGSLAAARFHLTPREAETLGFLAQGLTNKEIANRMAISANTVKAFVKLIMVKMGTSTRSGIVSTLLNLSPSNG